MPRDYLPLTDNRPGDPQPSREQWFLVLNSMFWLFDARNINEGVVTHLRAMTQDGSLTRILVHTARVDADFLSDHVRLSAINGGGSNGGLAQGTATYRTVAEWPVRTKAREIGIVNGINGSDLSQLIAAGAVVLDRSDAPTAHGGANIQDCPV